MSVKCSLWLKIELYMNTIKEGFYYYYVFILFNNTTACQFLTSRYFLNDVNLSVSHDILLIERSGSYKVKK